MRYFWKLMHGRKDNVTYKVYTETRKNFLAGAQGYIHEIYNICCKHDRMDIWHWTCPQNINSLSRIKKIIEAHHLKKDLAKLGGSNCAYSTLRIFKDEKYILEPWLRGIGRFPSTKHRRMFMYALLDTASYERPCKNCVVVVRDITSLGLQECPRIVNQTRRFAPLCVDA